MCQQQGRNGDIVCLFIVVILVAVDSQVCPGDQTWTCSNGDCIWKIFRCDGQPNCDGSDEQNCGRWICPQSSWKCQIDLKCIWDVLRCNGVQDCLDGTDERDCENWICPVGMWTCKNDSSCIFDSRRCDMKIACADGSDEQHCGTPAVIKSLTLDGHNDRITVDEDDRRTLNLTCIVLAADTDEIILTKEDHTSGKVTFPFVGVHNRRLGAWTDEAVVILSEVTCQDTGIYTCTVGNNGTVSKSIQLNVTCAGMKYGGRLTCPSAWKIGQNAELTLTIDRSKWPSMCRSDPDRREAWFEVIRWNDTGRQLTMCTVVNITSPGACQGNFTPGTIGCGCVSKTDGYFTLELNFVMDSNSIGNWSADTHCLRTDSSKPLQFHTAPECHVRLVCENNTYGTRCQESCGHCADDQTCNAKTGHCLACTDGWLPPLCKQGCENETYGARCQESCGQCANNQTCNASTGHCLACLDGWLPPLCKQACENNTYGARCQESCGQCADNQTCNATTGHCPACLDGWLPPFCKQGCENNTYGASCQESCGHCADDQACNANTGHCLACLDGWLPPFCKQACDNKTYGTRCQESCGHCADDQTCNTSTGHCLACLDEWLPPFCKQEAPAEESLSYKEKIAIVVGIGAPAFAVLFASLFQVCQLLSNMGYMPCISFGDKKEDKKTEEGGTEEEDEESDDAELSICSRCLMCMLCGGCVGSCMCCVTRGKMKSQGDVELSEYPSDQGPVNNDTKEPITFERQPCQERVASISEQADKDGSEDSNLEKNHEAHNETRRKSIPKQAKDRKKFTEKYFTTAGWLADPFRDPKLNNPPSWHRFYTSSVEMEKDTRRSSAFTFNSDELEGSETEGNAQKRGSSSFTSNLDELEGSETEGNAQKRESSAFTFNSDKLEGSETEGNAQKRESSAFTFNSDKLVGSKTEDISQAGQTIGKFQQGSNTSLRRGSAQNKEQVHVIKLMAVSEAEQGMSSVGQDVHTDDRSSECLKQPEQKEQTTGNTQSAGNSNKNVLEGEGSHRRTSQISGHSVDSGLS